MRVFGGRLVNFSVETVSCSCLSRSLASISSWRMDLSQALADLAGASVQLDHIPQSRPLGDGALIQSLSDMDSVMKQLGLNVCKHNTIINLHVSSDW